jgi:hypothetical protein
MTSGATSSSTASKSPFAEDLVEEPGDGLDALGAAVVAVSMYSVQQYCTQCTDSVAKWPAIAIVNRALEEPDPAGRLRLAAHFLRALYSSGFDVVQLFDAAMDDDAETRALLRAKLAGRKPGPGHGDRLARRAPDDASIGGPGDLPGAGRDRDLPGTGDRVRLDPDQFEDWVANALCQQLLPA